MTTPGYDDAVVRWVTAFLDFPAASLDRGIAFWQAVTGYGRSPWRGDQQQFATLLPPTGDAFLRVQRVGAGPPGVHLDLHTDDITGLVARARELGATDVPAGDVATLRSPAGFVFCVVDWDGEQVPPPPVRWPSGSRSLVDQVCIDIPPARFEDEAAFWAGLTGWRRYDDHEDEFERLAAPPPLKFLLQRLDDEQPAATAHLDLGTDDPDEAGGGESGGSLAAEVARHLTLGASERHGGRGWVTLADPAGLEYCVTAHPPG